MPKVHRAFRPKGTRFHFVRVPGLIDPPPTWNTPGWYRTALELVQDKEIMSQLLGRYTEKEAINYDWS